MNPEMNQEMNSEKNPEVFISYSSSDADKAIQVKSVLEENGFTCWMDTERIKSGSDYTDDIPTAIYGCRALVIIMSENSQKSKWVKKEVTEAINQDKKVFPYMIENCQLNKSFKFMLTNVQQIPAYKDEEAALTKIIQDLRDYLNTVSDEEIVIEIKKKPKISRTMIALIAAAAVLIAFFGIRYFSNSSIENQLTTPAQASVYYSEVLPYTEAGNYATVEETSTTIRQSLEANRAFSLLSFIRNTGGESAFVESISVELPEMETDTSAKVGVDAYITDAGMLRVFAINDGWGDSQQFHYSVYTEKHADSPEFSTLKNNVRDEGHFIVEKENVKLIAEFPLDLSEISSWAKEHEITSSRQIANLFVSYDDGGETREYAGYVIYHPDTDTLSLDYGGIGDNIKYSVTLYAMLDVDQAPSSIRFTGENAAPLIEDRFRIETVIIPTKSVNLKCQGVYSIDGNEQRTDVYDVHVSVPVFKEGYFSRSGAGTRKLAELSMDDELAVKAVLDEARYDPEIILEGHMSDGV